MPGAMVQQLSDANFQATVENPTMPTLVAFTASWCPHCPEVERLLPSIAADFQGRAQVCQADVDACPKTAQSQEISAVPTVCFYQSSTTAAECLIGGRSLAEYEAELNALVKSSLFPKSRNPGMQQKKP